MKILLVRLSSMGDLIHTLPAIEDLARQCPDVELHWLCEAGFADIARLHPFVKKIHVMKWRQWRKHLFQAETWREMGHLKQTLRQEAFNFVLDSQGLIKSACFAKMAKSPIYGLDKNSAREGLAALAYAKTYAVPKGKNAVWRNRELFAQVFGYAMPETQVFGLTVPEAGRMPKSLSLQDVQLRFSSKFPDKTVLKFTKNYEPVTIQCPLHGSVVYGNLQAAMKSSTGCPECTRNPEKPSPNAVAIRLEDTETGEIYEFASTLAASKFIGCSNSTLAVRLSGRTPFDRLIRYRYRLVK